MIYTVTLNPALDYRVRVPDLKMGAVNRMTASKVNAGGKGINVSRVLKNLGYENTALGFAAGFTGNQLIKELIGWGCDADFISLERGMTRINIKIEGVPETEINGQGPEIPEIGIRALMVQLEALKREDILVLSGSVPASVPENIYEKIMEAQENKGIKIVVDTSGSLLKNVLKYRPFLVKPNHHELGDLFHTQISGQADAIRYGRQLQQMGAVNVLISMAGEGAVLIDGEGKAHAHPAPKGTVISSVGAGDSMVAGFLAGYLESGDYEQAFRMGIGAGSASAFSEELATRGEIEALMVQMDREQGEWQ